MNTELPGECQRGDQLDNWTFRSSDHRNEANFETFHLNYESGKNAWLTSYDNLVKVFVIKNDMESNRANYN